MQHGASSARHHIKSKLRKIKACSRINIVNTLSFCGDMYISLLTRKQHSYSYTLVLGLHYSPCLNNLPKGPVHYITYTGTQLCTRDFPVAQKLVTY